jgi:hypothetical protein
VREHEASINRRILENFHVCLSRQTYVATADQRLVDLFVWPSTIPQRGGLSNFLSDADRENERDLV